MVNNEIPYFYHHVQEMMRGIGMDDTPDPQQLFDVTDKYLGQGYGHTTQESLGKSYVLVYKAHR